ncbi:diguanylate cyclase [Lysobacter claricitrinus]|uniref:diguanylate cyclase n=1 Tax=Lysobacter claricitrinus TaxID=3367728 RepID=UPI0037DBDCDC
MSPTRRPVLALLLLLLPMLATAATHAPKPRVIDIDPATLPLETIDRIVVDHDGDTVPDRKGERVRVHGTVLVGSGVLRLRGIQIYIQDATGGLGLFNPRDPHMTFAAGDIVEAWGEVSQFKGGIQLQDVQVRRIGHGALPAPLPLTVEQADGWEHVGRRVRIEGIAGPLTLDQWAMLRITGEDGVPMQLYVPAPVVDRFDWKRYPRGTRIAATGVLSIYKPTWPFDGGFQVVLADSTDIAVLEPPPPEWHRWFPWALGAALGVVALAGLMLHVMQRRQRARDRELSTLSALSGALADTAVGEAQLARNACEILTAYGIVEAASVHVFDDARRLHHIADAATDPRLHDAMSSPEAGDDGTDGLRARLAASGVHVLALSPMPGATNAVGVLAGLSPRRRRPSQRQERTLLSAAKLLAMAVENQRIRERAHREAQELQKLVITDELTRLYNRRFLDEYLRVQLPLAERRGGGLTFVALDVDHFKRINDTYGHDAGDRVLAGIAAQLRQVSRSADLPVRLGGEEFLVVTAEHDIDGALAFAERLREAIAAQAFDDIVPGESLRVTVSIGVALFGLHGCDATTLMRASDEAMYASKRGGRDRVSLSTALAAIAP